MIKIIRENLPYYNEIIIQKVIVILSTILCYLKMHYWNIKIGPNCKFKGIIKIRKMPFSNINIGKSCIFNSSHTSNLIGINHPCIISTLSNNAQIKIGDNCGFSGTIIGAEQKIHIGNNVRCGANTIITDSDWHTGDSRIYGCKSVVIEDNVWLGLNVVVLKGVTIGRNSIIGANTTLTKSIPESVVVAGNPVKIIRKI